MQEEVSLTSHDSPNQRFPQKDTTSDKKLIKSLSSNNTTTIDDRDQIIEQ